MFSFPRQLLSPSCWNLSGGEYFHVLEKRGVETNFFVAYNFIVWIYSPIAVQNGHQFWFFWCFLVIRFSLCILGRTLTERTAGCFSLLSSTCASSGLIPLLMMLILITWLSGVQLASPLWYYFFPLCLLRTVYFRQVINVSLGLRKCVDMLMCVSLVFGVVKGAWPLLIPLCQEDIFTLTENYLVH